MTTPEASDAGGTAGSTGLVLDEVYSYDVSGSKLKRTEKDLTVTMEPPRKKRRESGECKICLAAGVSDTSLVAWKHESKVTKKCREMQETWAREQIATPAGVTVVVAAAVAPSKQPRGTARGEVKAPIGTTPAAQANAPRGSAGK